MKINLKEKISKVKQIKSPESAMENPEQTMEYLWEGPPVPLGAGWQVWQNGALTV